MTFSDGTYAKYIVEELIKLRPPGTCRRLTLPVLCAKFSSQKASHRAKWEYCLAGDRELRGAVRFLLMDTYTSPCIIVADRVKSGVVIEFDDGKGAFYSASLLRAVLAQAEEIDKTAEDD